MREVPQAEVEDLPGWRTLRWLGGLGLIVHPIEGVSPYGARCLAITAQAARIGTGTSPSLTLKTPAPRSGRHDGGEHRRNIVTRSIELNALVGHEFTVGGILP